MSKPDEENVEQELEGQDGTPLPKREVMSLIATEPLPPVEGGVADGQPVVPPVHDEPMRGGEEL